MSSLNKVMIIGNLGSDPEIRTVGSGSRVANLRVATTEKWTDKKTGDKKEHTDWHSVVVWNENLVSIIERFVRKGSKLWIEGQLKTRKFQDKSGADRYVTEVVLQGFNGSIVLLDGPSGASGRSGRADPDGINQDPDDAKSDQWARREILDRKVLKPGASAKKDWRDEQAPMLSDEIPF